MKHITKILLLTLPLSWAAMANADQNPQDLIAKGAYLARAGDCTACHTASGGKPFAGGYKIVSGLGTIFSTNITPSKTAGIGNYSEKQFADAVRKGIRADGAYLYPAMPYPDYRGITDADIHALYTYFMQGVAPVDSAAPATDLSFPFSQRWGMRFWNYVFTDDKNFQAASPANEEINRGKYLVETLGHCGSCHTPRGIAMQEKSLNDSDSTFLAGGDLNGWPVPSLRHMDGWKDKDIADYLGAGRNDFAAVGGEMTSVVQHSMQYMSDADLMAIAHYLKSLPDDKPVGNKKPDAVQASSETTKILTEGKNLSSGQLLYLNNCEACHWTDGNGAKGIFPHLNGSDLVRADNPNALIGTILKGAQTPSTSRSPSVLFMPGFASRLTDEQVAELATFIRGGWSNNAPAVTTDQVKKVRDKE
ncbi:c-type cytochrome [Candidatus Pantoea multigeneris]|uniref:C-type cytochrome n=1 Tax=Candidatus Pantoea multigeneris TaxID=2608357 RepID=A0ABX0R7G3_9GAMM|nr:cytochrome c [Pantoea multigeneris]NIF20353.1 c-type cytochrome [Pantoea multigeneris]